MAYSTWFIIYLASIFAPLLYHSNASNIMKIDVQVIDNTYCGVENEWLLKDLDVVPVSSRNVNRKVLCASLFSCGSFPIMLYPGTLIINVYIKAASDESRIEVLVHDKDKGVIDYVYNKSSENFKQGWNTITFTIDRIFNANITLLGFKHDEDIVLLDSIEFNENQAVESNTEQEELKILDLLSENIKRKQSAIDIANMADSTLVYEEFFDKGFFSKNVENYSILDTTISYVDDNLQNIFQQKKLLNMYNINLLDETVTTYITGENGEEEDNEGENENNENTTTTTDSTTNGPETEDSDGKDSENDENNRDTTDTTTNGPETKDSDVEDNENDDNNQGKTDNTANDTSDVPRNENTESFWNIWTIVLVTVASASLLAVVVVAAYYLGKNSGKESTTPIDLSDLEAPRIIPRAKTTRSPYERFGSELDNSNYDRDL